MGYAPFAGDFGKGEFDNGGSSKNGFAPEFVEFSLAEVRLQVSAHQLAATLQYVSDLVVIIEDDFTLSYASPSTSRILGHAVTELIGSRWLDFLHPDDVAAMHVTVHPGQRGPSEAAVQFRARQYDDTWRYFDGRAIAFPGETRSSSLVVVAQDITATKQLHEQQTRLLLEATINGQEEERERICFELHDGVCQSLATAFQYLDTVSIDSALSPDDAGRLERARELIHFGMRQARELVSSLRPNRLDALGLVVALRYDLQDLAERTGIGAKFEADTMNLPSSVETAIYRIVHEALNNVFRHAHAAHVSVTLRADDQHVGVEVCDDGVGFSSAGVGMTDDLGGIGLISMRRRTELLGGHFEVRSAPSRGTLVTLVLPRHQETSKPVLSEQSGAH